MTEQRPAAGGYGDPAPARPGARCGWAEGSAALRRYHDTEWGRPSRDEAHLFEMLVLETMQAGLSWATVLAKRENYRRVLDGFDAERIACYDEQRVDALLADPGIIRNRAKVRSMVGNARAYLALREDTGGLAPYLWSWVADQPVVTRPRTDAEREPRSALSDQVSRALRRRGFRFLGSITTQAYLESVGVLDDHVAGCPAVAPTAS